MRTLRMVTGVGLLGAAVGLPTVPADSAPPPVPVANSPHTITLITGDKVQTSPDLRQVRFLPGPGRHSVRFSIRRHGDDVTVVPSDAAGLIASGKLDSRLFELRQLMRYDDSRSTALPLIVTYSGSPANLRSFGATVRPLAAINGAATRLPKSQAAGLYGELTAAHSPIKKVWLDGLRKPPLDQSTAQIGAPAAWAAGLTGKGVKVAVLDSGVDATHPDFKDRLTAADFTGEGLVDNVGHGTHVASIAAGSGAASDGKYRGVAPDAQILAGKVCTPDGCPDSAMLAGMDWAVQQGARIVNVSLGGADRPDEDPVEAAVRTLSAAHGTLFVIAAGNEGPGAYSVDSPGSSPAALTVGAVDRTDQMADTSSRGPTVGDGPVKPDVTAPGVGIVAAKSAESTIGEPVGTSYLRLSGTSMATPHVTGAAALLAQEHPDWTGGQLKAALMESAHSVSGVPLLAQGTGRIDVAAAIKLKVLADTSAIGFAAQQWPHTDDKPEAKTVTYTNDGDAPVQLSLATSFNGPDGKPAPAGALQLSTSSLAVPAHGAAQVVVTSNTNHTGPAGQYTGTLTATPASGSPLTTTLAVRTEQESYNLTIKHLDRAGKPTTDYYDFLPDRDATDGHDNTQMFLRGDENGVLRIRLPKGRYLLESVFGLADDAKESSDLVLPKLDLTADRTFTVDAREARPLKVSVPEPGARRGSLISSYELVTPISNYGGGIGTFAEDGQLYTGQLGPTVPGLTGNLVADFATVLPDEGGTVHDSPVVYQLNWSKLDGYFNGFTKAVRDDELTTLRPKLVAGAAGSGAVWYAWRISPRINIDFPLSYLYTTLPYTPTIRMTVADDFTWSPRVAYSAPGSGTPALRLSSVAVSCRAGRSCVDVWGQAVLTPVVPDARVAGFGTIPGTNLTDLSRTGDKVVLSAGGADAAGHVGYAAGSGTFTLTPDGGTPVEVPNDGSGTSVDMPTSEAAYQLSLATDGAAALGVSTKSLTTWRFKSGTTTAKTALPLWTVQYRPVVDLTNTTRSLVLPLQVQPVIGAKVGRLATVGLQTSTDDGQTWQAATVRRVGDGRYVAVVAAGAGAVSLKTTAADSAGNKVEQVISHAYNLSR
ncbi:S8 family serine peptidase [Kribbella sp. NPDC026611]|uniref:S8 family serine peptidase n=1 Tax=Kribbella sp. NPDC026611 TaxID=3154911 RepID=UPI0033E651C1